MKWIASLPSFFRVAAAQPRPLQSYDVGCELIKGSFRNDVTAWSAHKCPLNKERSLNMKFKFVVTVAFLLPMAALASWAAEDGAALYKKKCAGCHGANGEGKPAMKAPALKGTKMEADQIVQHLTKGEPDSKPPHNKGISGLSEEQAKAIADYIKTLK